MSLRAAFLGLVLVGSGACAPDGDRHAEQFAASVGPSLAVIDCGRIEVSDATAFGFSPNLQPARSDLFVPCYLIEHPKGRLLFDAGLPAYVAESAEGVNQNGMQMTLSSTLDQSLQRVLQLTPEEIDFVAFSHMHFDHTGHASLFTESTQLVQQAELDAAYSETPPPGVLVELIADLQHTKKIVLNGDHDVFGDGTVQLISTPGHTPGHQALLVRLAETGSVLLSGDLYHFPESLEHGLVPLFNTDTDATRQSMQRIQELVTAESAALWIEHDPALAESLQLAPFRYR